MNWYQEFSPGRIYNVFQSSALHDSQTSDALVHEAVQRRAGSPTPRAPATDGPDTMKELDRVVVAVRRGDPCGASDLYHLLAQGIRFLVRRKFPKQEADDALHDVFIALLTEITEGRLRDWNGVLSSARQFLTRKSAGGARSDNSGLIRYQGSFRSHDQAEVRPASVEAEERRSIIHGVLSDLDIREREALQRFYVLEESPDQICQTMCMTPTECDGIKREAKRRFTEQVQMAMRNPLYRMYVKALSHRLRPRNLSVPGRKNRDRRPVNLPEIAATGEL